MTIAHHNAVVTWTGPSPVAVRGTLVVLPGRGESPDVYERFGRRLSADAYRVHVITAPTESLDSANAQLREVLADADADTPRIVVGSDAGAAYAAYLAASSQLPGVAALVLAGVPTSSESADFADWNDELDARTSCPTHRARITQAGVRPAQLSVGLPDEWLAADIPTRIGLPVLGIHGQADTVSPVAAARNWYAQVPRAELVTITAGRHDVLNDQTHRSVAATVVLFLERLRGGADLAPIATTENLASTVTVSS